MFDFEIFVKPVICKEKLNEFVIKYLRVNIYAARSITSIINFCGFSMWGHRNHNTKYMKFIDENIEHRT